MNTRMNRLHTISIVLAGTLCAQALAKSDTITLIGGDVLLCTIPRLDASNSLARESNRWRAPRPRRERPPKC